MLFFSNVVFTFYFSLYVIYPTAIGFERVGAVEAFSSPSEGFTDLLQLCFLGREFEIDITRYYDAELSGAQKFDLALFFILYYMLILITIVLLLNLLIAMLSFTFEEVRSDATLQCRLAFARNVLRLETYAQRLGMRTRVGKHIPEKGKYVFEFRTVSDKTGSHDPFTDQEDREEGTSVYDTKERLESIEAKMEALAVSVDAILHPANWFDPVVKTLAGGNQAEVDEAPLGLNIPTWHTSLKTPPPSPKHTQDIELDVFRQVSSTVQGGVGAIGNTVQGGVGFLGKALRHPNGLTAMDQRRRQESIPESESSTEINL
jgi:hypothetical protein